MTGQELDTYADKTDSYCDKCCFLISHTLQQDTAGDTHYCISYKVTEVSQHTQSIGYVELVLQDVYKRQPYIIPYKDKYRLYYCVSAFGRKTSYIGLAESTSPEGPWTQKGCIVKTDDSTAMNAIDPSVIADENTGKWWMHYGSFFGGLYCVELNPETGLALNEGDLGQDVYKRQPQGCPNHCP